MVEHSGHPSRAAQLMDAFMKRIDLDGRSLVLPLLVTPLSLCSFRLRVFRLMEGGFCSSRNGGLAIYGL